MPEWTAGPSEAIWFCTVTSHLGSHGQSSKPATRTCNYHFLTILFFGGPAPGFGALWAWVWFLCTFYVMCVLALALLERVVSQEKAGRSACSQWLFFFLRQRWKSLPLFKIFNGFPLSLEKKSLLALGRQVFTHLLFLLHDM